MRHACSWDLSDYLQRSYKHPRLVREGLGYAAQGLRVIPLTSRGKKPRLDRWPERSSCDPDTIIGWFERWPDSNLGIV